MTKALLVISIHREELAFGRAVDTRLDPAHIDVLEIPGVSRAATRGPISASSTANSIVNCISNCCHACATTRC